MFRIKICGITTPDDARAVVQAGADAVGLNFFPGSPRFVTPTAAHQIVDTLPDTVVKVGLFVNAAVEHIREVYEVLGLDLIQLHGDEPPELIAELGQRPVMRAFRIGPEGLRPVTEYLHRCRWCECMPQLVLFDAHVPGQYGGTGATAEWAALRRYPAEVDFPPFVLAGGLTPQNVADAITAIHPSAVDTASGVETSPGRKDPAAIKAFVRAAIAAFDDA